MTFVVTLLSFAITLFLAILGVVAVSLIRGIHPNMTIAYRAIAIPVALAIAAVVLVSSTIMEVRHYRQAKALGRIANQMHPAH